MNIKHKNGKLHGEEAKKMKEKMKKLTVTLVASNCENEVLIAQSARISKSNNSLADIRLDNDIVKAQRTVKRVVNGEGHGSVAEHTVLTFDIEGISRLALETIQRFRHASFTERSQRYVPVLNTNTVYTKLKDAIFNLTYNKLVAQEDARYCLPLTTTTQLTMTINARELVNMIRKCKASKEIELKTFGNKLISASAEIIPSLVEDIRHDDYAGYDLKPIMKDYRASVVLEKCDIDDNDSFFNMCLRHMNKKEHQAPDSFAHYHLTFALRMSASAYSQLKRHRLAAISKGPYNQNLEIPASVKSAVKQAGIEEKWKSYIQQNNIINASMCKIKITFNLQDFYNFCRLRMDKAAQWEIREITEAMAELAKESSPAACQMLCGYDTFTKTYNKNFKS